MEPQNGARHRPALALSRRLPRNCAPAGVLSHTLRGPNFSSCIPSTGIAHGLYAHPEELISSLDGRPFTFALIARRANGEPTQHLTGKQGILGPSILK